ncbi:MAG TPA: LysR family transcriptional regulator, partial [Longimicrobiales bacterium]|nr:LysR family transcriptional regulator [Longimicrobiales bacterium]
MPTLNYRHLLYFQAVAHEGSVTAAAELLHVSQPSVSAQVRKLERALGYDLFDRSGRSMTLTHEGKVVLEYADEIFRLGRELQETIRGRLEGRPMRLVVGLAATIPNLVAFHLLDPAFGLDDPVRLVVRESRTDRLLADLATHDVDLVLADMPIPPSVSVQAFNHPLGSSPVDIFGPPLLCHRVRAGFPGSLDGQPFLLPAEGYALRRSLEDWFARHGIQPLIVAEVEDNDLIHVLAEAGAGMFAAPSIIHDDIRVRYAVERVGRAEGIEETFYAITADRRLKHPAVVAITEEARDELE